MSSQEILDSLPEKWKNGEIGLDQAAMKVMEIVYTNPGRFNLLDMEEDERSDFLLETLPKFRGILERYDKSLGPLGAYVYYSLPGIRASWTRKKLDIAVGAKAAKASVRAIYEDVMEKNLRVAEPEPAQSYGKMNACQPLVFRKIFGKRGRFLEPKNEFYMKRSALILALKSAWYIDDESVKRVSGCLGCSAEKLASAIAEIKDSLVEKNKKRERLVELRDRSWYFICKYRERLMELEPNSEDWIKTKRKLEYQLASWKSKNNRLQGGWSMVAPRNNDLAKLLRIKPYKVSLFLKYAQKLAASGETVPFPKSQPD